MPSGAKKRKAAKKKKTNITQLHGEGDELVVHDGKDSDGSGEVNSPLSHHDADDDLHVAAVGDEGDGDKEEEDPSSVRSIAVVESEPLLAENGESTLKVVTVEEEIAIENKPTNPDPEIHENPSGGDSDDDSDSSSSSSSKSSDDESQTIETTKKNIVMEDLNEAVALELSNPVLLSEQKDEELAESPPSLLDLSSKPDDLLTEITQSKSSSDAADVIELDTAPMTGNESVEIAMTSNESVEIAKDDIPKVEIAKGDIPKVEIAKDDIPKVEIAKDDIPKVEIAKDEIPKVEIAKVEIAKDEIVTILNNNGEIRLKENEIKVDKQVSTRVLETTTVTATVMSSSTVVSTAVTNNVNDQPRVIVTTPKPTQRTSLASCCGLFELFTGSHR